MAFSGEGAVKGGAGGAVAGGAIGGPWGAVIGGGAGALIGGFGGGSGASSPQWSNKYNLPGFKAQWDDYNSFRNTQRGTPQFGESSFRGGQDALVKMLQAQAAGRGPGQALVRMQAQQMADRSAAQQLAASQGQVGGGAMAARNAAMGTAAAQSQVGGQAAMGGLAAQLGATEQLGGVLQGARGQDLARGQANAQLELQAREERDQALLEALRQRQSLSGLQQGGQLAYLGHKAGFNQIQMQQPTLGDRLMGFGVGVGQMKMGQKS